jgi:hypothetical protein
LDADPDPAFQFGADADPAFHFDANPDPAFLFDADPDPVSQIKGLVAGCHSFCLFFVFSAINSFIHIHTIHIYTQPFAGKLSGKNLPVVPSRESNSGLPYSKPMRYQLIHAAPS